MEVHTDTKCFCPDSATTYPTVHNKQGWKYFNSKIVTTPKGFANKSEYNKVQSSDQFSTSML
jgi:hypothetical protein